MREKKKGVYQKYLKNLLDRLLALVGTAALSWLLLGAGIAVRLDSPGPVLFRQKRYGFNNELIEVLKFRSMYVDKCDATASRLVTKGDPRVTRVGRFIRKTSLDELPQLFNVLNGSMSIVGPRPERPEIAAQYCEEMPEFSLRLQAKAGLTGYAQVYGKYNTTPYDKLTMDLMYIAHPSIVEDLKIMFATVKILFMPESTEGISEGQTTAMSGENH